MYARYTDRARKVLQLANQEGHRFNHASLGPEHILLGLVKESCGIAANVIKSLEIDLQTVRTEVERLVTPTPGTVTMGKLPHEPLYKKVLEFAEEEACSLAHNYVGTEHILLGLLRVEEGIAAQVFKKLGLTVVDMRAKVLAVLGGVPDAERSQVSIKVGPIPQEIGEGKYLLSLQGTATGVVPTLVKDVLAALSGSLDFECIIIMGKKKSEPVSKPQKKKRQPRKKKPK